MRPADRLEPGQVGVHGRGLVRDGAERRDVGHGEAGCGVHRRHAARGQVAQRGAARLELGAQGAGPCLVPGVLAAAGRADDEVALGDRGLALQRPEQPADVGAALGACGEVGDPAVEAVQQPVGTLTGGTGRLGGGLVADPLDLRAQRPHRAR